MKLIKIITYYLNVPSIFAGPDISQYVDADIPIGSKILNVSIDNSMMSVMLEFIGDESKTERIKFNILIINHSIDKKITMNDDYIYVDTVIDSNPQISTSSLSSSTNSLSVQFTINPNRIIYRVFRQMTFQEKRDFKIEEIIDKK